MDYQLFGQTLITEVMVKMEPLDIEPETYSDIKCEDGIVIVKTERPATPVNPIIVPPTEELLDDADIKSEITLSGYECVQLEENVVVEPSKKNLTCDQCGSKFARKHHLVMHLRIHTGEKPFVCDLCGHDFLRIEGLDRHKRMHSGIKPYACDECGLRFAQRGHLKPHKQTHTGAKPFSCDECDSKFSRRSALIVHKQKHTGNSRFVCDICGIKFMRKQYLVNHRRVHTGEKPFVCDECGMQFTQKPHLHRHRNMHEEIHLNHIESRTPPTNYFLTTNTNRNFRKHQH